MKESSTSLPKVSVICLCYNQATFVSACIQSVLDQTYANVEIIIVNDASPDKSAEVIRSIIIDNPEILFLDLPKNVGNCKAFNQGLKHATGKYVIDLSCDDELELERIAMQVDAFEKLPVDYGVLYSDAVYINEKGEPQSNHFKRYTPAKGNIYSALVARYFIAPPTMMIKKAVLNELNGYDENMAYEDFDFWVRSSRKWKYDYLEKPLTRIRITSGSLSSKFHETDNPLTASTLAVCKKIKALNTTGDENKALAKRLNYELKIASLTGSRKVAKGFFELLCSIHSPGIASRFWILFSRLRWNIFLMLKAVSGKR